MQTPLWAGACPIGKGTSTLNTDPSAPGACKTACCVMRTNFCSNGIGLTSADSPLLLTDYNPKRNTLMVDWSPTAFSRLRLQFASDKARAGMTDNQVLLQYIYSLGAHGAHTF